MDHAPPTSWRDRAHVTTLMRITAAAAVSALVLTAAPHSTGAQPEPDPAAVEAFLADPDAFADLAPPLAEGAAMEGARAKLPESVRDVPVVSSAVRRTEAELAALETTILTNRAVRDQAVAEIARLEGERAGHRALYSALRERRRLASIEAEQLRGEIAQLAVAAYVGAGSATPTLEVDAGTATESGRQRVIVEAVDATLRDRLAAAEAEVADAGVRADQTRDLIEQVAGRIHAAEARRDAAIAQLAMAEPELPRAQERYHDQFMLAQVDGADFAVVALHAYRTAADQIAVEQPSCRLPWTVLAGIARVESRHGTYGGSTLRVDGTTSRRILGVALDGSPGIMHIPDTDGGALDGDPVYDRAVGPMQFIPSTWRMVRRDGNGNGRMDPHNMYDATLAAAVYLCRNGVRLDRPAALNQAILTYNRSQPYASTVLSHHRTYQRLNLPG
jgi:membrane-bound lytic murein transglycosylase B